MCLAGTMPRFFFNKAGLMENIGSRLSPAIVDPDITSNGAAYSSDFCNI